MERPRIVNQSVSIEQVEEEIRTPLTGCFHYLKERAVETNLLCIMDVEALMKLAELNQLQQRAGSMKEASPEFKELHSQFNQLYRWLQCNKYHVYRDEQSGLWSLSSFKTQQVKVSSPNRSENRK